jgi:hypothetical protein
MGKRERGKKVEEVRRIAVAKVSSGTSHKLFSSAIVLCHRLCPSFWHTITLPLFTRSLQYALQHVASLVRLNRTALLLVNATL